MLWIAFNYCIFDISVTTKRTLSNCHWELWIAFNYCIFDISVTTKSTSTPSGLWLWIAFNYCIFDISVTTPLRGLRRMGQLWIAFNYCIFDISVTTGAHRRPLRHRCELLSTIVSLTYQSQPCSRGIHPQSVVNCFQLLYLWHISHNAGGTTGQVLVLWIAFNYCIFDISVTTGWTILRYIRKLWIAFNYCIFDISVTT